MLATIYVCVEWVGANDGKNFLCLLLGAVALGVGGRSVWLWGYNDAKKCLHLSTLIRDRDFREIREEYGIDLPRGEYNLIEPQFLIHQIQSQYNEKAGFQFSTSWTSKPEWMKKMNKTKDNSLQEFLEIYSEKSKDQPYRTMYLLSGGSSVYCRPGFRYNHYTAKPKTWDEDWNSFKKSAAK